MESLRHLRGSHGFAHNLDSELLELDQGRLRIRWLQLVLESWGRIQTGSSVITAIPERVVTWERNNNKRRKETSPKISKLVTKQHLINKII